MLTVSIFILFLQTAVAFWLFYELITLSALLPPREKILFIDIPVDAKLFEKMRPMELLQLIYKNKSVKQEESPDGKSQQFRLLTTTAPPDKLMNALFWNLNFYFVQTHFTARDSNEMRAIVNEHTDAPLRKIRIFIFMPIVLGLFDLLMHSSIEKQTGWGLSFGLFYGTALSILFVFRTNKMNSQKRILLMSIQDAMLLPLSSSLKDSILDLRDALNAFGKKFATQVATLGVANKELMEKTHKIQQQQLEAIKLETGQLRAIASMDFPQITRFNTETLETLRKTISDFGALAHLTENLTNLILSMEKVTQNLDRGLVRTEKIGAVADIVLETMQRNSELQEFLTANMKMLANSKEFIGHVVGGIDNHLSEAFGQLQNQITNQVQTMKTLAVHEQLQLEEAMKNGAIKFEKLNKLDELSVTLVSIRQQNEMLSETLKTFGNQFEKINTTIQGMDTTLKKKRFWF